MQEIVQDYMQLSETLQKHGGRLMGKRKHERMLMEKRERWCRENCIKSGNQYTVQISAGNWVQTDKAGAARLLNEGWENYRANR